MTVIRFNKPEDKNLPSGEDADIIAEYGSRENMIEKAKRHALEIVHSSGDDDPMEVAIREIQTVALAGTPSPDAFYAAVLRDIDPIIEGNRY